MGLVAVVALILEAYDYSLIKYDHSPSIYSTLLPNLVSTLTIDLGCLAHVSWHLHLRNLIWPY